MLPLLPALILLLLQGPSNVERLALEGRLPAALQAVHATLDRPALPAEEQRKVLAQLLSVSSDAELTRVFASLLALVTDDPETKDAETPGEERSAPTLPTETRARVPDGFLACQRSRDGPSTLH